MMRARPYLRAYRYARAALSFLLSFPFVFGIGLGFAWGVHETTAAFIEVLNASGHPLK